MSHTELYGRLSREPFNWSHERIMGSDWFQKLAAITDYDRGKTKGGGLPVSPFEAFRARLKAEGGSDKEIVRRGVTEQDGAGRPRRAPPKPPPIGEVLKRAAAAERKQRGG